MPPAGIKVAETYKGGCAMTHQFRGIASGLIALSAILLIGFNGEAQAQARELTMGNVNPPKHGTSLASQQFIDKLAEVSGGKLKVIHHHSAALGGEREVAQQIQL